MILVFVSLVLSIEYKYLTKRISKCSTNISVYAAACPSEILILDLVWKEENHMGRLGAKHHKGRPPTTGKKTSDDPPANGRVFSVGCRAICQGIAAWSLRWQRRMGWRRPTRTTSASMKSGRSLLLADGLPASVRNIRRGIDTSVPGAVLSCNSLVISYPEDQCHISRVN